MARSRGLDQLQILQYAFDDEPHMGNYLSIGWVKKDLIEELIQIETENSVRIFPRYVPYSPLYDDIEEFCWSNQIHLDRLKQSKIESEAELKKLENIAERNNLDFQEI